MRRPWITALTLATVVGSGGAFVGAIAASSESPVAAQPRPSTVEASIVEPTTPTLDVTGTVAYQVGEVGTVTVSVAPDSLAVSDAVANPNWTTTTITGPGADVEVQFTDAAQLVTFKAELVGTSVAVTVTNVAVPTAATNDASVTPPATTTPRLSSSVPAMPAQSEYDADDDAEGDDDEDHDEHEDYETEHEDD